VRLAGAAAPLLTAVAFLVGPVALLAPLGLAPLLTVAAVGLAVIAGLERRFPVPSADLATCLALMCALALASTAWAVDPAHSFVRALRLVAECVEGLLLIDAAARLAPVERARVLVALTIGLGVLIALAVADALMRGELMRWLHGPRARVSANNRGATVLAIVMWPTLLFLLRTRGRLVALGGWAVGALGVAVCASTSAQLAAVLATVVFAVAGCLRPEWARVALRLAPIAVLGMPLVPLVAPPPAALSTALIKPSVVHRLVIWQFTNARIGERPLFGWGLDSARAIPGGEDFAQVPGPNGQVLQLQLLPLHPHNGALELWLELGAFGALLGALVVLCVVARLRTPALAPVARAAGLAALTASAVEVSLTYGLWQSWWIAALWFAAFAVSVTFIEQARAA
jgi:O-antigen ligase